MADATHVQAENRRLRMRLEAIEKSPLRASFAAGMTAMARVASGCSRMIRSGDGPSYHATLIELAKNVDIEAGLAGDAKVLGG